MTKPDFVQPARFSNHVVFGVHGDIGAGKTRLIGTTTQIGRTLGIKAPQEHWASMLPEDKKRIEQAVVETWDDMWKLQEFLRSEGGQYDWVWLDGGSTLFDVLLDDIWDDVVTLKPERNRYGLDKGEYGVNMERLARWLRFVIGPDLFNFGFTTHTTPAPSPDLDDEGDPVEKLMPAIPGKGMPTKFASYTNVLAFMETATIGDKPGRRVLRTEEENNRYYAKDQFDAFGGRVVDPTMPKVMKLIEASPGYQSAQRESNKRGRSRPASRRVVRR